MKKILKYNLLKKILIGILALMVLTVIAIWLANKQVELHAQNKVFESVMNIPQRQTGLLLGTSKYLKKGRSNLFYKYRIQATVALFNAKKIKYVIISGDHSEKYYNEPADMRKDLIALGVPDSVIFLDYAGLRTLDSVVRCKEIFGQTNITIISQQFHNERALYIADECQIDAVAFNAQSPSMKFGVKTYIREYFARVNLFTDLLIGKRPKYLGKKIKMPV